MAPRPWKRSAASAPARPSSLSPKRRSPSSSLSSNTPIIVAGPTGVGKSAFAAELACRFGGEIIGADAYQIYSGLGILTAQPGPDLLARAPHHLIGILPPSEPFDAARFVSLAREKMAEISARGRVPIIVGGSGLYVKALTHGLVDSPDPDPSLRAELSALPLEDLQRRLEQVDPSARAHIDFQNPRRVLRALEIFLLSGATAESQRSQWKGDPLFAFRGLLLTRQRPELEERIAGNVRAMFRSGVIEEVQRLGEIGPTARMAIGLREIHSHLEGRMELQPCIDAITLATRRYAKRQLTWFRNQFTFQTIDLTGLRHTLVSPAILSGTGLA